MKIEHIILGGGIAGMGKAVSLSLAGKSFVLLEKEERLGGLIQTLPTQSGNFELGPNSVFKSPELSQIIAHLGLEEETITSSPASKSRFIFHRGKVRPLKISPTGFMGNKILSPAEKWRAFREISVKTKSTENETLHQFFTRRFGQGFADKILDPGIRGIYAQDPEHILTQLAFPELLEMESKYGSIIKALKKQPPQKREILNFKGGMVQMTKAFQKKHEGSIRLETKVLSILSTESGFKIEFLEKGKRTEILAENVSVCLSATALKEIQTNFGLENIPRLPYTAMQVLILKIPKTKSSKLPMGFGFLCGKMANRPYLGLLQNSVIFPENFNQDSTLATVYGFLGKDRENIKLALEEDLNLRGMTEMIHHHEIPQALPSYNHSNQEVNAALDALEHKISGIKFYGNYRKGISVPKILKSVF